MDETTRTIHLILQLEQALKHMQAARDLSRREPAIDDAWRVIDEYRQRLILGLTPREDMALELARSTGDPNAITIIPNEN